MINKTEYTFSQIEDIIDYNLQESKSFMFVSDFALAHGIYDYIHNDYGIIATVLELSTDINEYYVSLQFYPDGDMNFFCEFAKGEDDNYKYDEVDNVNYYIFNDMSFGDVREFLTGKGELEFCKLVDDVENDITVYEESEIENDNADEYLDDDNCLECQCNDCRTQRHEDTVNESIDKAFNKIMESECCPSCIVDALMEFSLEMKRLGWSDHSDYIRECDG